MLSELRRDRHLTQKQLSELLHVSVGTISNYENNTHLPDLVKLKELADYFNVSTDYLLGRCDSPDSPDVFAQPILPGRTAGSLHQLIRQLPPDRRTALAVILEDMEFHATVSRYNRRQKPGRS